MSLEPRRATGGLWDPAGRTFGSVNLVVELLSGPPTPVVGGGAANADGWPVAGAAVRAEDAGLKAGAIGIHDVPEAGPSGRTVGACGRAIAGAGSSSSATPPAFSGVSARASPGRPGSEPGGTPLPEWSVGAGFADDGGNGLLGMVPGGKGDGATLIVPGAGGKTIPGGVVV
jgi:hypothetical protein